MSSTPSNSTGSNDASDCSSLIKPPTNVVFFDGTCGLCNGVVDFLLRVDLKHDLYFAPLQGKFAAQLLTDIVPSDILTETASIVFFKRPQVFLRSNAVIEILRLLPGLWRFAVFAYLIPRPVRDAGYRFIAMNRLRWFGKRSTCRIPTPEERPYFLD